VDRYVPLYRQGWDSIRSSRFTRMKSLGLVDSRWDFTPRSVIPPNTVATLHGWDNKQNPAWSSLASDRREDLARRMAIYAAMIDIMDYNIGRLLDEIERSPRADNTVIVFLSDNGACAEWDPFGFDTNTGPNNILHKGAELETMGQPGTYHSYGSGWANACATPFRLYKHYTHEGGITTPFIVAWNKGLLQRNVLTQQCGHVIDILPTFAALAGATIPVRMDGISLVPAFQGGSLQRGALFFEHEGNRAVRSGKWKLVARGPKGPWQLYDMEADRTEMHNLAAQRVDLVKLLSAQWREWAEQANVLPWPWN
jgi:arylsulfatase A-like enzyme